MSAIEKIQARLTAYAGIRTNLGVVEAARTITVLPAAEDGFVVTLTESSDHWTVSYDGWHEEFSLEDVALECFAFGLSSACRLRVEYQGERAVKWTVEELSTDGAWVTGDTTALSHPFFWGQPRVRYFQNRLLPVDPIWLHSVRAT